MKVIPMHEYEVKLNGKYFDTVFMSYHEDPAQIREQLIDEGYHPNILVSYKGKL